MLTAPDTSTCPCCKGTSPAELEDCPKCHASAAWRDRIWGAEFAARYFSDLGANQRIDAMTAANIAREYCASVEQMRHAAIEGQQVPAEGGPPAQQACANCGLEIEGATAYCGRCGSATQGVAATLGRYLLFVDREIGRHVEQRRLAWPMAQVLQADVRRRMVAMRDRVEKKDGERPASTMPPPLPRQVGQSMPEPAAAAVIERSRSHSRSHRGLLEILLDARTIHWMLMCGAALLAVGLVIWLASLGIFRNPWTVAAAMGAANVACLLGGFAVIRNKKFPVAGRGLTLLACLVMPLNLWFYQRHGLMTIEGHLWLGGWCAARFMRCRRWCWKMRPLCMCSWVGWA